MKEISVSGVSAMVPEKLEELSQQQLLKLLGMLVEGRDELNIKLSFAREYWKLPVNSMYRLANRIHRTKNMMDKLVLSQGYLEAASKLFLLCEQFNFLLTDRKIHKNPLPVIRRGSLLAALYGPSDGMKNITIWEFAMAENQMLQYANKEDDGCIDNLLAILYRPRSVWQCIRSWFVFVPDLRLPFNDANYTKRLPRVNKISAGEKLAVVMFFNSVRESFKDRFPHIYNEHQKRTSGRNLSWGDVIIEMSGEVPGNEEKVGKVNLYTFLYRLELNAIKVEEMEKEMEQIKNKK